MQYFKNQFVSDLKYFDMCTGTQKIYQTTDEQKTKELRKGKDNQ